jgi:hypothetical protein
MSPSGLNPDVRRGKFVNFAAWDCRSTDSYRGVDKSWPAEAEAMTISQAGRFHSEDAAQQQGDHGIRSFNRNSPNWVI